MASPIQPSGVSTVWPTRMPKAISRPNTATILAISAARCRREYPYVVCFVLTIFFIVTVNSTPARAGFYHREVGRWTIARRGRGQPDYVGRATLDHEQGGENSRRFLGQEADRAYRDPGRCGAGGGHRRRPPRQPPRVASATGVLGVRELLRVDGAPLSDASPAAAANHVPQPRADSSRRVSRRRHGHTRLPRAVAGDAALVHHRHAAGGGVAGRHRGRAAGRPAAGGHLLRRGAQLLPVLRDAARDVSPAVRNAGARGRGRSSARPVPPPAGASHAPHELRRMAHVNFNVTIPLADGVLGTRESRSASAPTGVAEPGQSSATS